MSNLSVMLLCVLLFCVAGGASPAADAALVIEGNDGAYMMRGYFVRRAADLTSKAHRRWTPAKVRSRQEELRRKLLKTFFMPPDAGPAAESTASCSRACWTPIFPLRVGDSGGLRLSRREVSAACRAADTLPDGRVSEWLETRSAPQTR